jgi:hypothetical protein
MEDLTQALSASIGGIVSTFVLYPIEIVKNNLQASTNPTTTKQSTSTSTSPSPSPSQINFTSVSRQIYNTSGISGFYSGVRGSCTSAALEKLCYYYAYSFLSRKFLSTHKFILLGIGYVSDFIHLPITMVFEKIMLRQQIAAKKGMSIDFLHEFQYICKEEGIFSFYYGWNAYFVLAFKPAIENFVFDYIKSLLLSKRRFKLVNDGALGGREAFLIGAFARAVATMCAYPAYRGLRLSQAKGKKKKHENEKENDGGLLNELKSVIENDGWSGLYQGMLPDITRGVLSSALRSSIKERLHVIIRPFLLINNKR